jgi:Spy/CpxP family protein refolding chaperone
MKFKIPITALGALAAGVMAAQTPAPAPQAPNAAQNQAGAHRLGVSNGQDRMLRRMTTRFNLTPDQQVQVKAILKDAREQNKGLNAKVREERMALHQAVKVDSVQQIDQITQQNAKLNAQVAASHLKTVAKIYATLTPDQKAKFDQRFDHAGRHSSSERG